MVSRVRCQEPGARRCDIRLAQFQALGERHGFTTEFGVNSECNMICWLRDCDIHLCLAASLITQAAFRSVDPAAAEPGGFSAEQGGVDQAQSDSEQEPAGYDGGDITRPQNQLDLRFRYRTSSQPDTLIQQERMLLRVTSKLKLDLGWRAGLYAEMPLVNKRTTTFEPSESGNSSRSENKFGLGDAAYQAFLAHDLDRNWSLYGEIHREFIIADQR